MTSIDNVHKRGRGRPKGSGAIDDHNNLGRIAALIAEDPSLKPWSAIKQVCGPTNESIIRRLYRKWNQEGEVLIAKENDRIQQTAVRHTPPSSGMKGPSGSGSPLAELEPEETTWVKALREAQNSPRMARVRDIQNSPAMRQHLELMKTIQKLEDSPWMRAVREAQNSPATKAAREFERNIAIAKKFGF